MNRIWIVALNFEATSLIVVNINIVVLDIHSRSVSSLYWYKSLIHMYSHSHPLKTNSKFSGNWKGSQFCTQWTHGVSAVQISIHIRSSSSSIIRPNTSTLLSLLFGWNWMPMEYLVESRSYFVFIVCLFVAVCSSVACVNRKYHKVVFVCVSSWRSRNVSSGYVPLNTSYRLPQ